MAASSLGNLAIYGIAFVGLIYLARKAGAPHDTLRLTLDAAIVAGSLFFVLWSAVYRDAFEVSTLTPATRYLLLTYPVLDSCLVTVAFMAFATPAPGRPRGYGLFLAGFIALFATDATAAYFTLRDAVVGVITLQIGQTLGLAMLAVGAIVVSYGTAWRDAPARSPALWVQLLPIWPIALALGTAAQAQREHGQLSAIQFWTAVAVIGLAMVRLGTTLRQNFLLQQALEASSALKTQLLRFVSHEMGNPLSPLRMELHGVRPPNANQSRAWQVIDRNMDRLVTLSNDVRDMSLAASGRIVPSAEDKMVAPIVQAACQSMESVASARRITITCETAPDVKAHVNEPRLGQVLDNLLSNAIKFSPDGSRIRVNVEARGEWGAITVTDEGKGLTKAQLKELFQPFSRPNSDRPGMGLGLYISSTIVEQLGGRIEADSPGPDLGATFTILLPAMPEQGDRAMIKPST